jgi:F-type H+-transporting ATPase subunit delta
MNKFIEMCNEFYGIKNVKVITAKKLNEEQIQKISYTLKSKFQINEIYITNDIDETIIGGIKVILDNKTYDSTFKTKMQSMKETLYKTINQGE